MANEFVIKNGLTVKGGTTTITGSLVASSITGSLQGTASFAATAASSSTGLPLIGGTIASGQVAFGTASGVIGGDAGLFWDNVNKRLGIGGTPGAFKLDINGSAMVRGNINQTGLGFQSVSIGPGASISMNSPYYVAIGNAAGAASSTGGYWTALGPLSGKVNTTGNYWTSIGFQSGESNISGGNWTAIGSISGNKNTNGSNWISIGHQSARFYSNGVDNATSFSNGVYIGTGTRVGIAGANNEIVIGYNAIGLGSNTVVLGNDSIVTTALKGNVGIGTTTPQARLDVRAQGALSTDTTFRIRNSADTANLVTVQGNGGTTITGSINSRLAANNNVGFQQSESISYSLGIQNSGGTYLALAHTGSIAHSTYSSSLSDMRIGISAGTSSLPAFGINIPAQIVGFSLETGSNYTSFFAQRLDTTALGGGPLTQAGLLAVYGGNEQYEVRTDSSNKSLNIRKYDTAGKSIELVLNNAGTGFTISNNLTSTTASLFKINNSASVNVFDVLQHNLVQVNGSLNIKAQGALTSDTPLIIRNSSDTRNIITVQGSENVGIGTDTPEETAILDVSSTVKGFLPPRMREFQRDDITSPAVGLMIYNTDTDEINVYTNNNGWRILAYV